MIRRGILLLPALLPGAALAEANGTLVWLLEQAGTPLVVQEVGTYALRGTELIGVDSLTFSPSYGWPWFPAPEGTARVVVLDDPQDQALSKAAILFSDAAPVCGEEVGAMPVDTGTGAFLDRPTALALDRIVAAMGPDCNLYDCLMAEQVGEAQFARMIRLPDGSTFPAFSTGYGDGVYPVYLMYDANGDPVAAYADFLGTRPSFDWLAPPVCPTPAS